jgi:hypothetical protein
MMPTRQRTRSQARADHIKAERTLNDAYVAERNKPPQFEPIVTTRRRRDAIRRARP